METRAIFGAASNTELIRNLRCDFGRAVVTGVGGFIGSHLAETLVRRGVTVTGIDNRCHAGQRGAGNIAALLANPGFTLINADVCASDLMPILAGNQVVFHLAAIAGVRPSWGVRFRDYLNANVVGTQRLIEACEDAGVKRLVLASSSSVYGPHAGKPSMEEDQLRPSSPYGVSKLAAERLALAYANRPGAQTSVVALRYFSVYGPRQRPDMWISRVLHAARDEKPVNIYGDGSQRRDFTYIDDVVAANVSAATVPGRSEVINVGGGSAISMLDVLNIVANATGKPVRAIRQGAADGDVSVTEANLAHAYRVLGYEPQTDLRTGISRQWAWMTERPHDPSFVSAIPSGAI
jgi:nucleoside-diphosphate-sugar epimerase